MIFSVYMEILADDSYIIEGIDLRIHLDFKRVQRSWRGRKQSFPFEAWIVCVHEQPRTYARYMVFIESDRISKIGIMVEQALEMGWRPKDRLAFGETEA